MKQTPRRMYVGAALKKGEYPRLGGKLLLERRIGYRYVFRGEPLWLDYIKKYTAFRRLKASGSNWVMISNRYEYLKLMDTYSSYVNNAYVMHYGSRRLFTDRYYALPSYFSSDFVKNAGFRRHLTFEQFKNPAGNIFCVPHNQPRDRPFFSDLTNAGALVVTPIDVDAYMSERSCLGLMGNFADLVGQVRFMKMLSDKKFRGKPSFAAPDRVRLKRAINAKLYYEPKSRDTESAKKLARFQRQAAKQYYPKTRGMRANKARSPRRRLMAETAGKPFLVGGFVFTEEERKFQEAKLLKFMKNAALERAQEGKERMRGADQDTFL